MDHYDTNVYKSIKDSMPVDPSENNYFHDNFHYIVQVENILYATGLYLFLTFSGNNDLTYFYLSVRLFFLFEKNVGKSVDGNFY